MFEMTSEAKYRGGLWANTGCLGRQHLSIHVTINY